ncbi:hypothetical protein HDV06_001288 [Boothiomyces sp. JEL0866]|nr:hypothetical protein HDV06_001288 [Boothiomyces sp. JEL0866]
MESTFVQTHTQPYMKTNDYQELKYGMKRNSSIPNIIWTFWDSNAIPKDIQKYIDAWKISSDYDIRVITRASTEFKDVFRLKFADQPQRISDFIRLAALEKHGGIWLDASMILNCPLNWVNAYQSQFSSEFVGYYLNRFTTRREFPVVENWFLAAVPHSQFITDWKTEFYKINEFDSVDGYVQYILKDTDTQNIDAPHYLTMHIAAQKVLQTKQYNLTLLKAEDTPYIQMDRADFRLGKAVALLKSGQFNQAPLIKLSKFPRICMGDSLYSKFVYIYEFLKS